VHPDSGMKVSSVRTGLPDSSGFVVRKINEVKEIEEEFLSDAIEPQVSSPPKISRSNRFVSEENGESPIVKNIGNILKDMPYDNQTNPDELENIDNLLRDSPLVIENPKINDEITDEGETAPKVSKEVVGFQCSASNCSQMSRVFKTRTATSALTKLKNHHAKSHTDGNEIFSYTILYKEGAKEQDQSAEPDDPLKILKKLKRSHKKAASGSGVDRKLLKILDKQRKRKGGK